MTTYFYTASTLDGFLATQSHSLDWLFAENFDQDGPMAYPGFIERIGALVLGASTYEWLLDHGGAWEYSQPAWVFTHRDLPRPQGADVRLVQGDPGSVFDDVVASAGGKDVWVMGGGDLASQVAEAGLLDEVWIQYAPVALGSGRPLFTRPMNLELIEIARNQAFVCTRYRVLRS